MPISQDPEASRRIAQRNAEAVDADTADRLGDRTFVGEVAAGAAIFVGHRRFLGHRRARRTRGSRFGPACPVEALVLLQPEPRRNSMKVSKR